MKYYIAMYFKCISEKGTTYYSAFSFEYNMEFTNEVYNEIVEFIKYSVGEAVKENITSCETVSKEEYDKFQKEERPFQINILEGQE